jgi:hypothetical protein
MKLKITIPEKVVWSAETREVSFDMNGTTLCVRLYEDDSRSEIWVQIGEESFVRDYEVSDPEITTAVNRLTDLFRSGAFDEEGYELDTDSLDEDY